MTKFQTCTVEVPSSNIHQDNHLCWTRIAHRQIRQFPGLVQRLYHGYLIPSALLIFHYVSKHRGPVAGLMNLWHACLNWHAEWFHRQATFPAVSILFFCPTSFSALWRKCVYIHIRDCILWNNQQMQLYVVNFIPLLGSLYMFRVFYTPIIRSTIFNCIYNHWYKPYCKVQRQCYKIGW